MIEAEAIIAVIVVIVFWVVMLIYRQKKGVRWLCPNCGLRQFGLSQQCPQCGVVFKEWKE